MTGTAMLPGTNIATETTVHTPQLFDRVREMLESAADALPFHGWSHTAFVRSKAVEFASERDANVILVEAAALVHDLNYLVARNSSPRAGQRCRYEVLVKCGFDSTKIQRIEQIILGAHMEDRRKDVDVETACLSDADTLYKALPITPVLFSHRYLAETRINLGDLAAKIIREQIEKIRDNYYFYDEKLNERYGPWAKANLQLWEAIVDALDDPDVVSLVEGEAP